MVELIVRPDVGKAIIQKSGVFSVHRENALLECNCPALRGPCGGIAVGDIPLQYRAFQLLCMAQGKAFISKLVPRGYEWRGGDLLVHGPWPSKYQNLQDASAPAWSMVSRRDPKDDTEHPERFLSAVGNIDDFVFMDYVLVAEFLIRDEFTDLELT